MAKFIAIILIAFTAISINITTLGSSKSLFPQILTTPESQGGVLEFKSSRALRFENSSDNCDSVMLNNYSGLPLKALQIKLLIFNNGKIKLKAITRGSSIPTSDFIFDYQIHQGELNSDGSSIDAVMVVLLGNGNSVLLPSQPHHILSIEYDILSLDNELDSAFLKLTDVLGATCTPVMNANIKEGTDKTIMLQKQYITPEIGIALEQNYPNPFNPSTKIHFEIFKEGFVEAKIFNSIGEEIKTLLSEYKSLGKYYIEFQSENLPSGIYFYQFTCDNFIESKKMILVK